jgi:hypothetical protein
VAGTKVTLSEIPYSETRESDVWSEHDWYDRLADSFAPSPRFGEKGSGDEGQELSASTLTTQTSNLLIPIEQVAIGSRVPTKNPRRWEYDFALPEPNQGTWKRFSLTALDDEGAIVEAEFIRPDWWIEENGIAAGELMPLAIEELGLSGYATIQTVEDCGPIARGDGSVVTGRFTTSRVNVIVRLTVAGPDGSTEVLEGTTVHPIWSLDRNDWIQLSELQEGERLQAANGIATVVSIAIVSTNVPVYNIEVHGEHVYQVGELGLLVHNTCPIGGLEDALRAFPGSKPMNINRLANLGGIPGGRQVFDPGKLEGMGPWNWGELDEPIQLIMDNGVLRIQGGFTRIEAALRAGITQLPVVIR